MEQQPHDGSRMELLQAILERAKDQCRPGSPVFLSVVARCRPGAGCRARDTVPAPGSLWSSKRSARGVHGCRGCPEEGLREDFLEGRASP